MGTLKEQKEFCLIRKSYVTLRTEKVEVTAP